MKRKLSVLLPALLAALMLHTSAMAADEAEYKATLEQAQTKIADTAKKVQLWSTSEILLGEAAKAAESGDYDLAVKLANEAILHCELAVATAEREKKIWQNGVPK